MSVERMVYEQGEESTRVPLAQKLAIAFIPPLSYSVPFHCPPMKGCSTAGY